MSQSPMNLPKEFALYIGNAYPHKNLPFLIDCWQEISLPLVLAGGRSVFYDRLQKQIKSDNIIHLGHVENLNALYKKAKIFVFPTLMEGFGLPPLEAMKNNVPVVCSDIPVLHEVLGSAPVYFDPQSRSDFVKKITSVLKDKKLQEGMKKRGQEQVKKYSWEKMARETMKVYESVGNNL